MTTLTDVVAAVVVQSSAMAFSHFGIALEPVQVDRLQPPPAVERVVARTPRKVNKVSDCPETRRPRVEKA
jgi:hypothetical protein